MPIRRRRKLSTAMRAVAAVAVASPVALIAVTELAPEPQQREFTQAAMITDLPGELMSALSQGLSQFGINLPPMPTGLLNGGGATPSLTSPSLMSPGLTSPGLTDPGLMSPGLTSPGLTSPSLTDPALASPGLTAPGLTSPTAGLPGATPSLTDPGLTNPSLTAPGLTNPSLTAPGGLTTPSLTDPGLTSPGLANPALTSPTGLTIPGAPDAAGLTTPALGGQPGLMPAANTLTAPGEMPITDPGMGTYPLLGGDPGLGAMPAAPATGGGGLFGDLSSAANQLGAGQAIDLLKGMVMPAITSAVKAPAAVAPVPPPAPLP